MAKRVGIIGVGKLGTAVGRLALEAGWDVWVTDQPDLPMLDLIVDSVLPGARLVDLDTLLEENDVVVAAVPQHALAEVPLERMGSRILVDATNAWAATDPPTVEGAAGAALWERNPGLRRVKTLNHLAYADLLGQARPRGAGDRRALVVAGDDEEAVRRVSDLVSDLGYDTVDIGLEGSWAIEPDGPVFGRHLTRPDLTATLVEAGIPGVDL